jgi:hypothetical protein
MYDQGPTNKMESSFGRNKNHLYASIKTKFCNILSHGEHKITGK